METSADAIFNRNYQLHLQHLKLKGLQPKTIDVYSLAVRRVGERFDQQINNLSAQQLTDYFTELVASHSWSTVKLDLYGLKFYYAHVLRKPWAAPGLIKAPRTQRLPDIVTVAEAQRLFAATRILSCRMFFFTLYSLGLRLGEGLRLQVGDIDAGRARAHPRCQGQQGPLRSAAGRHAQAAAQLLAGAPQPRLAVPESPGRLERQRDRHHAARSWRRADRLASGGPGLRPKKRSPPTV
jgi:integrase